MRAFIQNSDQSSKKNSFTPFNTSRHTAKADNKQYNTGSINHNFNQVPLFPSNIIQPKLTVNQPNDIHEQEADAMADRVMNMPGKTDGAGGVRGLNGSVNNNSSSHGSGKKMDRQTERFMSNSFGFDFRNISIHTNDEAVNKSRGLDARAFTVGNNIYFNKGEYNPSSSKGKQLLAHELTHTIQQSNNGLSVQKDDKEKPEAKKPEIDFNALPPDFKLRMWHLLFEADTSKVQLDYETKGLKAGLSYKYGSALTLSLKGGGTSGSVGFTPGDNQLSLGLSHGPFSAGFKATPEQQKYAFNLHLGDKLLPSPADMSQTFNKGGAAGGSLISGVPGALDNPLDYYKAHKSDIDDISKSVDLVKDITDAGKKKINFGADFSLSYDPEKHVAFTIRVGALYRF